MFVSFGFVKTRFMAWKREYCYFCGTWNLGRYLRGKKCMNVVRTWDEERRARVRE